MAMTQTEKFAQTVKLQDVVSINQTTLELYGYKKFEVDERKLARLYQEFSNNYNRFASSSMEQAYSVALEIVEERLENLEAR